MSTKRVSLAELIKQDEVSAPSGKNSAPAPVAAAPKPTRPTEQAQARPELKVAPAPVENEPGFRNTKSDFVKVSVTLPPEMFDTLQDLSRERRKAKQEFTMSALIREAVEAWEHPGLRKFTELAT